MAITALQLQAKVSVEGVEKVKQDLSDVSEHAHKAGGGFKGMLSNIAGFAAGGALVSGVGAAFGLVTSQLGGMVQAGMDANAVQAQTAAALKSTHDASGMTAQGIGDLATKLMGLTGINDDVIQGAENILLTFTGISKKAFPDATKAVADMATAMHIDLNQAALQVGKALNDPLKGMTALQREGVTFTKQQKEQIAHFTQVGDKASAQKIILGELKKEFGGSAEAAGKANGGLKILGAQFDNMKQSIGQAIIPVLSKLVGAVSPLVTQFGKWLPGALKTAQGFIEHNVMPVLGQLGDFVMKKVVPAIISLAQWAQKHILPVLQTLGQVILQNVLPALGGIWDSIQQNLLPAIQKLWEKIEPILIPALKLVGWILQHVVGPAIGLLIAALGKVIDVIANVIGWVSDKLGGALGFIGDKVIPSAKKAFTELRDHIADIWSHITSTVKGAVNSIIDIVNGMIRGINSIKIHVPEIDLPGGGKVGGNDISFPQIPQLPHLARGGRIVEAGLALVGEQGPELVMLPPAAKVTPLSGRGAAGGALGVGTTYHVTVNGADAASAQRIADQVVRALRRKELLTHAVRS